MKKILAACLIIIMVFGFVQPGYCYGPMRKLGRGIWNMITFPCEFPNRIYKTTQDMGHSPQWIVYGVFSGLVMAGYRAFAGVLETMTFPIPIPGEKYEPMVKDPEFFFFEPKEEGKK